MRHEPAAVTNGAPPFAPVLEAFGELEALWEAQLLFGQIAQERSKDAPFESASFAALAARAHRLAETRKVYLEGVGITPGGLQHDLDISGRTYVVPNRRAEVIRQILAASDGTGARQKEGESMEEIRSEETSPLNGQEPPAEPSPGFFTKIKNSLRWPTLREGAVAGAIVVVGLAITSLFIGEEIGE